tara:strand:- start:249 stop:1304 length:1056 start_codon:yes stop_codon:yes gene_type:complete
LEQALSIKLSKQDADELEKDVKLFLDKSLPKVIRKTVKDGAKLVVKSLEGRWPEERIDERNQMQLFRDRLNLRWSAGLDPLRMMLIASREVGQEFADKLARSKAKTGLLRRQAITMLHMRACQTTLEILTLLESGLPDGAYARWRTLYEISVFALVIDRFGDEIADRYLAHDIVSMREALVNEFRYHDKVYEPEKLVGEQKELEEEFRSVLAEFGESFAKPYGWAAHNLCKNHPRFRDLEEAVDWGALPPDYKWSSHKIHAGAAGTIRTLGSIGGEQFIHAGAVNAGLDIPAINTAYSLMQITSLVFGKLSDLEAQIRMQSLVVLRDRVVNECRKAARKLERDHLEFLSEQ